MKKNYRSLTDNIRNRINPEGLLLTKSFSDELSTISYSDVLVFIRTAMKGVDPNYTQNNIEAGDRVKDLLSKQIIDVSYKYQGSVMTNTHIKAYSDIDLLVISEKFYQVDMSNINLLLNSPEQKARFSNTSISMMEQEVNLLPYQGDPLADLRENRINSETILSSTYSICDISKPKSIKIKNQNLNREVDIVIANWYDDITSVINYKGEYRGIQVYNKDTHSRGAADYPFLSIKRINKKSQETNGRLKKMIRFIKNVKVISVIDIQLSSFDINAICYDIDAATYQSLPFSDLVSVIYNQVKSLCENQSHSDVLLSVDGREAIFRNNPGKLNSLKSILVEIHAIYMDLLNN